MAVHPNSLKNLEKRPKFTSETAGKAGGGRKLGSLSRSTRLGEWLTVATTRVNPVNGELQTLSAYDHVVLALIKRAWDGDPNAIKEVLDTMHGKIGAPAPGEMFSSQYDTTKLTGDELHTLVMLLEKCRIDPNQHITEAVEVE